MIETKSRSCKGACEQQKTPTAYACRMWLQSCVTKFAMFNFGAHGFNVKNKTAANVLFWLKTELAYMYGCSHKYNIYAFTNLSKLF